MSSHGCWSWKWWQMEGMNWSGDWAFREELAGFGCWPWEFWISVLFTHFPSLSCHLTAQSSVRVVTRAFLMTKGIIIRSFLMTKLVVTGSSLTTKWIVTGSSLMASWSSLGGSTPDHQWLHFDGWHVINWVVIHHFCHLGCQNVFSLSCVSHQNFRESWLCWNCITKISKVLASCLSCWV